MTMTILEEGLLGWCDECAGGGGDIDGDEEMHTEHWRAVFVSGGTGS